MKFQIGDANDVALCIALKHEYLRCENAFDEFALYAKMMVSQNNTDRRTSFKAYNAYARFVHHLYEFMIGAATRDFQDTAKIQAVMAERIITGETQRIVNNRREAILNGTAPDWENDIAYYSDDVPVEFARVFREVRNKTFGHITIEREKIDLTDFYEKYHKYLYLLYFDIRNWWGRHAEDFPDLKAITEFSVLMERDPPTHG